MNTTTLKTLRHYMQPEQESDLEEVTQIFKESLLLLANETLIPRTSYRYTIRPLITNCYVECTEDDSVIKIKRLKTTKPVIGIDSTCITLAESKKGLVLAIRASIVTLNSKYFFIKRVGPAIVYITEETINWLSEQLSFPKIYLRMAPVDPRYAKKLLMESLELLMLHETVSFYDNCIILRDGSLKEPEIQYKKFPFRKIVRNALRRDNIIIGISKRSNLFKWCFSYLSKLSKVPPPVAIAIPDATRYFDDLWGDVYFALFDNRGIPLRVDILSILEPESCLNLLYSSDLFRTGYPETLRRAHIYSKIVSSERLSLQLSLAKYCLRFVHCERERELLFGAFNKTTGDWNRIETSK